LKNNKTIIAIALVISAATILAQPALALNSDQNPALNDDQRFQRGFRDGCLNNFVPGSHSAAYQAGFDKGQHNACSEFRGGDGSSQPPSSITNQGGRNEQNPGGSFNSKQAQRNSLDWSSICNSASVILVQPCDQLVNPDSSLTADGIHAMHCIRNGAILALGGQVLNVPLQLGIKILTAIAPSFGCQNIVNFNGANKLSNLGVLQQIINAVG
jgi:hypothetical protein